MATPEGGLDLIQASNGDQPKSSVVVLKHPSGSQVYLVGTAHVSAASQQDVLDTIAKVNPAVVVLELDKERYNKLLEAAEAGDDYGLHRITATSKWKIAKMSLTGDVLDYGFSLVYVMAGAVMGCRPGGEFLAAHDAAQEVGAQVVLGDRSQQATMRRLRYFTHYLTRQDSRRQEEVERMRRLMAGRPAAGYEGEGGDRAAEGGGGLGGLSMGDGGRMPGEWPDFMRRGSPPATEREKQVAVEVEASMSPDDPWGLGVDSSEQGSKQRLLEFMREGGCEKPESVLQAAMRMFKDGIDPKAQVSTHDLLAVRECGNKVVENFRQRAMKEGDDKWMQRLELESVAGAKGAAGMDRSMAAMKKVVVDERDLILARRLWESGLEASGQPVVGVVGAGHIKGIQKYWSYAGTPAAEARVAEFMKTPQQEEGSAALTAIATGGVLAAIAYRRPKAAGFLVGAVTLATAPYLGFMIASMNRFGKLATKLVDASERASVMGDDGGSSSWPAEGTGEWQ